MSKKNKNEIKESVVKNYYDLKSDTVDDLVAALRGEAPEAGQASMNISDCTGIDSPENYTRKGKQKQFDPYKHDLISRIPAPVKALFIKWWFAGVICYFINMGLGIYISDSLDLLVLTGLVMGLIVDLMVNPIFRFMESDRREYNVYMMFPFPFKAFWTFFANMLYYVLVVAGVNSLYLGINSLITLCGGTNYLSLEPLLFGVFVVAVDMAFIGIKDLIVWLVKRRKAAKPAEVENG